MMEVGGWGGCGRMGCLAHRQVFAVGFIARQETHSPVGKKKGGETRGLFLSLGLNPASEGVRL